MAINIFEGARRISKLVAIMWVVAVSAFILVQGEPYIAGTYHISTSDRRLGPRDPLCESLIRFPQEGLSVKTKKGTEAHVTLCFPPETKRFVVTIPSGAKVEVNAPTVATEQQVITYVQSHEEKFNNRPKNVNPPPRLPPSSRGFREVELRADEIIWDWEAQTFADHVKDTLVLSRTEEEWIDEQWWVKLWEQIRQGLLVSSAGLVFLWGAIWSIGWIVRGFLGIPRGQDRRVV